MAEFTRRVGLGRPLTYEEADENFEFVEEQADRSVDAAVAAQNAESGAAQSAIEAADSADSVQIKEQEREQIFEDAQEGRKNRFDEFMSASGYQFLGDYAAGIEITEYNQILRDADGEFWRLSGQVELPYTTTGSGLPEGDALTPLGDAVLRQELDQPTGADKIAGGVVLFRNTLDELLFVDVSNVRIGQEAVVRGTHFTLSASGWVATSPVNIEIFGAINNTDNSAIFQTALDYLKTSPIKHLLIDGHDLVLESQVSSDADNLVIEFTNDAQLSQPTPSNDRDWSHQRLISTFSGDNLTFVNLKLNGKFDLSGLNEVPSPVGYFMRVQGSGCRFVGKTVVVNSGGYGLDVSGDYAYFEDLYTKNNAYAGVRLIVAKNLRSFKVDKYVGIQEVGPRARKTGLAVNGQNYIDSIEIGSYSGHNAGLFTEADASASDISTSFYKKVNIDYLYIYGDQDTQYPDGSPAANTLGKMENCGNVNIRIAEFINDCPATNGQNYWLHQTKLLNIDLLLFDGTMLVGEETNIQRAIYTYNGNRVQQLIEGSSQSGRTCVVGEIVVKSDDSDIGSFAAFYSGSSEFTFYINKYTTINNELPIVRGGPNLVSTSSDGVNFGAIAPTQGVAGHLQQNLAYTTQTFGVLSPNSITRDVKVGERFICNINSSSGIESMTVTRAGTCSWDGLTFTGTARFRKEVEGRVYGGSGLVNLTNRLSEDDIGLSVLYSIGSSPKPIWWTGDKWVDYDGVDI